MFVLLCNMRSSLLGTFVLYQRYRKPKLEITIRQSRETGNIGYTKHKTKTNKARNTITQYVLDTTIRKQTQIT